MTTKIQVLGTGCGKCKTMVAIVEDVVKEYNLNATIEKVEDIMEIMTFNVMTTPALVINGDVTIKGRVPSKKEILELLQSTSQKSESNTSGNCCSENGCC
jgi:small redox-active disulfide protein 2